MRRTFHLLLASALVLVAGCDSKRDDIRLAGTIPADSAGFELALYQSTGAAMSEGNQVELVQNGKIFDALVEEIGRAKQSVNILLFIWRPGRASDRVIQALSAKPGLQCRVLVDPFGSRKFKEDVKPRLEAAGCEVRIFREVHKDATIDRNHRKIAVIDGSVGFTGGFGIHDDWLGEGLSKETWRDTNVRVAGPAVRQLQQAFAENWQESGGKLLPTEDFPIIPPAGKMKAAFVKSSGSPHLTSAARLMHLIVGAATKRAWIANAYFVPSPDYMDLLREKARQGVEVRVLAPGDINDQKQITKGQRARYDDLLPTGVRIWEYPLTMMHSKTVLVDDHLAIVGSINLDKLSFDDLEEGSLVVDSPEFARALEQAWAVDLSHSKEIR